MQPKEDGAHIVQSARCVVRLVLQRPFGVAIPYRPHELQNIDHSQLFYGETINIQHSPSW